MTLAASTPDNYDYSFLEQPGIKTTWDVALEMFEYTTITITCACPPSLAEFPDLNVRLRGALGRTLHDYGALVQHRHDPFNRPSPYDLLYRSHGMLNVRTPIPKPIVVRGYIQETAFIIKIHLVGNAQIYAKAAATSMIEALEQGISLTENARCRHRVHALDYALECFSNIPKPLVANSAVLNFFSPLSVRSGNATSLSTSSFLNSISLRTRGILRWLNIDIASKQSLNAPIDIDSKGMIFTTWARHSIQQKGTDIPMSGLMGKLHLSGDLSGLLAALHIGELFGVGSRASLGLGAYTLAVYP